MALLPGVLLVCAALGCGHSRPGRQLGIAQAASLPASRGSHVVVLVMENREYDAVIGSPAAPYINGLAHRYALATHAYGLRHPSLPNYLGLTGGSTFGIDSDCTGCSVRAVNLVDQLAAARISWKAYMEDSPTPCFRGGSASGYAKKHDPFMYYVDVAGNPSRCARVVPYTRLAGDLNAGRLPTFSWISPNLCDDGHDCSLSQADRYLAGVVPALLRELGPRGFLVLTWDEGASDRGCCGAAAGGRVATIVAGPAARAGARSDTPYDHYSILRTVEDALGLAHLGQAGCRCTAPLDALFTQRPDVLGGPGRGRRRRSRGSGRAAAAPPPASAR